MSVPAAHRGQQPPGSAAIRIQLLDDTWILTLLAVLIATAAPRLLGAFEIDFGAVVWGVLGLGAVHVVLAATSDQVPGAWSPWIVRAVHAAGVILIGVIWYYAGGLRNPLFLLAFVLPVIGASFISRSQPYLTAAFAILIATVVAFRQTPELRWYVAGVNDGGAWLATLIAGAGSDTAAPFAGFYAPSGYFVVTLAVFATLLCACAVLSELLSSQFMRLNERANAAHQEAESAHEQWIRLVANLPVPAVLVEAETLQTVCHSDRWAAMFCATDAPVAGELFGIARLSYPEVVEELISGAGGSVRPCMFRVAGQLRVAEIHAQPMSHTGRRLALVIVADITESFCVQAALDAADYAAVVIDSEERVMGFNQPARTLFADIKPGAQALPLLANVDSRKGWWIPGLRGRLKSHAEIHGRIYNVRSSTVALPGEDLPVYVITLSPAANDALQDLLAATKVEARL